MVRAPYFDKHGMKKGEWSEEEDKKLKAYIEKNGHSNWRSLPKDAGLSRCGKSCRLRWMNYLRPGVKHGNFTKEEEDIIAVLHKKHGNKWSMMAAQLPGRSDNEIKNHWHTRMKNRVEKDQTDKFWSPETAAIPKECFIERRSFQNQDEVEILLAVLSSDHLPSSCSTRESSSSSLSALDDVVPSDVTAVPEISKPVANFWTDPFLPADNDSCVESSSYKMFSPLGFADDLMTTQASYEDYITDDVFLW